MILFFFTILILTAPWFWGISKIEGFGCIGEDGDRE